MVVQFRLFRKADNADDLLDVVVFKEAGLKFVRDTLAGLARGGIKADSGTVEYYQSSGVKVSCERDVPVEVDGEFWGRGTSWSLRARSGSCGFWRRRNVGWRGGKRC